jgi:hypothetical protein
MNLESLRFDALNNFEPFLLSKNTILKANFYIEHAGARG